MADQPIRVPSLEGIPEPLHPQFVKVTTDDGEAYEFRREDVSGLKSAKAKIERERQQLAEEVKSLREYRQKWTVDGQELDPEDVLSRLNKQPPQDAAEMITRAEAEKLAEEKHKKALAAAKKDLETRDAEWTQKLTERDKVIQDVLVDRSILDVIGDARTPFRLNKDAIEDLIDYVHRKNLVRVEGREIIPLDDHGEPLERSDGSRATMLELISGIVARKQHWLAESQGISAPASPKGGKARSTKPLKEWSNTEKTEFVEKHGYEAYRDLVQAQSNGHS